MDIIDKFIIIDHFVNDSDDAYIISLELNLIPLNVRGGGVTETVRVRRYAERYINKTLDFSSKF